MSSHREAPEISKDPVADNTDLYAFVSPDKPDTVTFIANFIPLEDPAGGPNFDEFGDDVLYEIHISNSGTANPDITYQFRFNTQVLNPNTFLYNTGPITSLNDPNWNVRQFYQVTKVTGRQQGFGQGNRGYDPDNYGSIYAQGGGGFDPENNGNGNVLASNLACPPCNVGVRSTPNYAALAQMAVHTLPSGEIVFAGQRADDFFVDLGSIFDLLALRPIQMLHLIPLPNAAGVDAIRGHNVHSIVLQVPMTMLTRNGTKPTDPTSPSSVIGVWASASRRKARVRNGDSDGGNVDSGPWAQVSRLGNPLVNEVIIPRGQKDLFNATQPAGDSRFVQYFPRPEVSKLLPVLYPNTFPNLQALDNNPSPSADRIDIVAILLTGLPPGIVPGFQNTTGPTQADMLRLNMAIPLTQTPNPRGVIAGDLQGYPNGRRLVDDVVTIEIRALAGATYKLVNPSYVPDAAIPQVTQGLTVADGMAPLLPNFPYISTALGGYQEIPPSGSA